MITGIYSVNFKNGSALLPDIGAVRTVVLAEQNVTIETHGNIKSAYFGMVQRYEDGNYEPDGTILGVPSQEYFQCNAWWRDGHYQPVTVGLPRQFVVFSAIPERVGYYSELDCLLVALLEEPVGTIAYEVDSYAAAVHLVQKYIAKTVGCFSGYFDSAAEFRMVRNLRPNCMMILPYREWMQEHCALPAFLQDYSSFGYKTPALKPSDSGLLLNNMSKNVVGKEVDGNDY